ncbi:MAG: hypothetical protein BWY93_02117 [Euryarchaeota archaeon ADurb.BinA087]|nr:MAG: hypothetical protein BWY93_02117 [Euryarchaeota archaeon ADurb.BinA087]
MVVKDQFRLAGCSRGEINDERVSALRPLHPGYLHQVAGDRCRIIDLLDVADPPREFCVGHKAGGKGRTVIAYLLHLAGILLVGDHHGDLGRIDPVLQVLLGEHRRARAEDRSQLNTGDGKDPPFRDAGEHDNDTVPLLHPVFEEHVCRRVREVHHLPEGECLFVPLLVHPDHGKPVPIFEGKAIDHIEPEIVIVRDLQ